MKAFRCLCVLTVALCALFAVACSGSAAPAPSASPTTASATQAPTNAPTQAAPPAATSASNSGSADTAATISAAMAKTQTATVFAASEKLSGTPALVKIMPGDSKTNEVVAFSMDGQFRGSDYAVHATGEMADILADDPALGLWVTQVGNKTYVKGPASALEAPQEKWYVLDPAQGMTFTFSPLKSIEEFTKEKVDWSGYLKRSTADSLDGQKCDFYGAEGAAAVAVFVAMAKSTLPPERLSVLKDASSDLTICADGYVHDLSVHIFDRAQSDPAKKMEAVYLMHLSQFNGNVVVNEPADAIVQATSATPTPASEPTRVPTSVEGPGYEGEWEGTTSDEGPVSFTVENNEITYASLSYSISSGGCSLGGSIAKGVEGASISGKGFTALVKDNALDFTLAGSFDANGGASGTLQVKGTSDICGAVDSKTTWTAHRTSAPTTESPTETPESSATAPSEETDAIGVVMGFFSFVNSGQVSNALALVSDNVAFQIGSKTGAGKDALKGYLDGQVSKHVVYAPSDLEDTGGIVQFTLSTDGKGSSAGGNTIIVVDGKIQVLNLE